jgi:hypothetical protein
VPVRSNTNCNANINIINDNTGDGGNSNNKEMTRNVEHEVYDHTVIIDASGVVTKDFKKIWKPIQRNIQWIYYKRQRYFERRTQQIRKVLQSAI